MEDSVLFHRLGKPNGKSSTTPFTFGCCGKGISDEADKLLTPIFTFDYMMAAQYEFGAVPNALNRIATGAKDFVAFRMEFPQSHVARHWREEIRARTKSGRPRKTPVITNPKPDPVFTEPAKVYVFCHKDERVFVETIIHQLVSNRYKKARDDVNLHCVLRPMDDYDKSRIGWLELNNGYFIYVDKEAWKKTVALFKGEDDADVRKVDDSDSGEVQDGNRTDPPPLRSGQIHSRVGNRKGRSRVRHQPAASAVPAPPPSKG